MRLQNKIVMVSFEPVVIVVAGWTGIGASATARGRFPTEDTLGTNNDSTAILELDDQFRGQDFLSDDPGRPVRRDDQGPNGRQLSFQGLIGIVFISQTTLETSTATGDF